LSDTRSQDNQRQRRVPLIRPSSDIPVIHRCREPFDIRRSIDWHATLVNHVLRADRFSTGRFVFVNLLCDKIKILAWERSGFLCPCKRFEQERFHLSRTAAGPDGLRAEYEQPAARSGPRTLASCSWCA